MQTTVQLIVLFMSSLRGVTFVFLNVHAVFVSRLPMGEIIFKEIRRDLKKKNGSEKYCLQCRLLVSEGLSNIAVFA